VPQVVKSEAGHIKVPERPHKAVGYLIRLIQYFRSLGIIFRISVKSRSVLVTPGGFSSVAVLQSANL